MVWVNSATNYGPPDGAVVGGQDSDGCTIFVGRAYHAGDLMPAKVIPQKNAAYVVYNGQELFVQNFEVLCGDNYEWVPAENGYVPEGAVPGGRTSDGETLFIGRAACDGSLTPGKIHPSHQCLYLPYGGTERNFRQYESLVERKNDDCSCCCCS